VRSASQYNQHQQPPAAAAASTPASPGGVKWYAPTASAIDAENVLRPAPDGAFMVRSSISRPGTYALAVKNAGAVEHMSINVTPAGQFYLSKTKVFVSLPEMIEYYMTESLESHFKRVKTCLAYPMGTTSALPPYLVATTIIYNIVIFSLSLRRLGPDHRRLDI